MATIKALVEQLSEAVAKQDVNENSGSIQILRASNVEVPVGPQTPTPISPEILRIRADFIAGKELASEDIRRLMLSRAEGGGTTNTNCGLC